MNEKIVVLVDVFSRGLLVIALGLALSLASYIATISLSGVCSQNIHAVLPFFTHTRLFKFIIFCHLEGGTTERSLS